MKKHALILTLALLGAGLLAAAETAPNAASATAAVVAASPTAIPTAAKPAPVATAAAKPADPWAKFKHLNFEDAKALHGEKHVLFVDARAKSEYDQGHIPGAIPLPLSEFDKYYEMYKGKIGKAKKLISYCHGIGCHLSDKVAEKLYDKGHKNTYVFFGGWPQWTQNNLPVENGDGKLLPTPTAVVPVSISPTVK